MIEYSVNAEFESLEVASAWVAWLKAGHLQQVIDGGALSATLTRHEGAPGNRLQFTARYQFADMKAFATYERDFAPPLRAESAEKFPAGPGIKMQRGLAEVLVDI